jgi:hypothetical protein
MNITKNRSKEEKFGEKKKKNFFLAYSMENFLFYLTKRENLHWGKICWICVSENDVNLENL